MFYIIVDIMIVVPFLYCIYLEMLNFLGEMVFHDKYVYDSLGEVGYYCL